MKNYFHKKEIIIPLYSGKLVIIFSNDTEKVGKYIPEYDEEDYALSWYDGDINDKVFIVLNFHHPDRAVTPGVVAHESGHCAHFILFDRGVEPSFINDEPITYLLDWCVSEIHKFAKEKNMKIEI